MMVGASNNLELKAFAAPKRLAGLVEYSNYSKNVNFPSKQFALFQNVCLVNIAFVFIEQIYGSNKIFCWSSNQCEENEPIYHQYIQ